MILIVRREGSAESLGAARILAEAVVDLVDIAVYRDTRLAREDLAHATAVILCDVDESSARRVLAVLPSRRPLMACTGGTAGRLLVEWADCEGATVVPYLCARAPSELRAVGLKVAARAYALEKFRGNP